MASASIDGVTSFAAAVCSLSVTTISLVGSSSSFSFSGPDSSDAEGFVSFAGMVDVLRGCTGLAVLMAPIGLIGTMGTMALFAAVFF